MDSIRNAGQLMSDAPSVYPQAKSKDFDDFQNTLKPLFMQYSHLFSHIFSGRLNSR
jgi:hypothetical protein